MEALNIRDDEEFLRKISKPVNFTSDDIQKYIDILKEYSFSHSVYAMAAIQLGIDKRIVFIKSTDEKGEINKEQEQYVMINPKIVSKKGKTEFWEACASGLDNVGLVERPYLIVVDYFNEKGKKQTKTFEGFSATVISHELDHLDGIFHMDRAKEVLVISKPERMEFRKTHSYVVISKDCDFEYPPLKKWKISK